MGLFSGVSKAVKSVTSPVTKLFGGDTGSVAGLGAALGGVGLIGGNLGGLLAGLGSIAGDLGQSAMQYYYDKKIAKQANDFNIAQWKRENEYNLPINQMERLRQAGLNPNLVYDRGATTLSATSKPAVAYDNVRMPQLDALNMLNAYQDIRQKDATTEYIRQQARSLRMENDENADAGTSKGTPWPIKGLKVGAVTIKDLGEKLGNKIQPKGDSVIDMVDDVLSGRYKSNRRGESWRLY